VILAGGRHHGRQGAPKAMKTQQLHQVLNAGWAVVADANRYFRSRSALGASPRTDPVRQGHGALTSTAEVIRQVAILAQPFMPVAAGKLLDLPGDPGRRTGIPRMLGQRSSHCARGRPCRRLRLCFRATFEKRSDHAGLIMLIDSPLPSLDFPDFSGELDAIIGRAARPLG